jgi:hypothetical protein
MGSTQAAKRGNAVHRFLGIRMVPKAASGHLLARCYASESIERGVNEI